jgi:hypothetical protein
MSAGYLTHGSRTWAELLEGLRASRTARVLTILALFPAFFLVPFYAFILQLRVQFGHWPSHSDGMAKYMDAPLLGIASRFCFLSPFVALGVVSIAFWTRRKSAAFPTGWIVGLLILSIFLVISDLIYDPGGFLWWAFD